MCIVFLAVNREDIRTCLHYLVIYAFFKREKRHVNISRGNGLVKLFLIEGCNPKYRNGLSTLNETNVILGMF